MLTKVKHTTKPGKFAPFPRPPNLNSPLVWGADRGEKANGVESLKD